MNDQIRISPIRLIDENNEQRGVVETYEALRMTRELGLDLVEIAPQERPPVCRIMDYGKHKYNLKKKQKQQPSHEMVMKEVRLRPKTDDNDRLIKINRAEKFLQQGHKVQFTMLFRGRERQHRDLASEVFNEITGRFAETTKIERAPKFEGRRMTMVLAPGKPAGKSKPSSPAPSSAPSASPPAQGTSAPKPAAPAQRPEPEPEPQLDAGQA
jgi:translation initiation factor IF-3